MLHVMVYDSEALAIKGEDAKRLDHAEISTIKWMCNATF